MFFPRSQDLESKNKLDPAFKITTRSNKKSNFSIIFQYHLRDANHATLKFYEIFVWLLNNKQDVIVQSFAVNFEMFEYMDFQGIGHHNPVCNCNNQAATE